VLDPAFNRQLTLKMKTTLMLKSLADLPADTLTLLSSLSGRARSATRQMLLLPAPAVLRLLPPPRRPEFARRLSTIQPWPRGGLNE